MQGLLVPIFLIAAVGSMIVPLPAQLLDFCLSGNLLFSLLLLITTFFLSDPLKLSALPTIILISTLIRLALNVSTTRLILGKGEAGETIQAFGEIVVGGNLVVGVVIFCVITLVQFLVIAKGSERVAEVSARFALDAMPGRQMSIDADMRAGLLDGDTARRKRLELQTESRFYGALDGAMKFVKGDAIAGIVIALVNAIGGIILGVGKEGLSVLVALQKYTLLTVGDGLLAQLCSLMGSIAAGVIVTRVSRDEQTSLSVEVSRQILQLPAVRLLVGGLALLLGVVPGMPTFPLLILGALLIISFFVTRNIAAKKEKKPLEPTFQPRPFSLIHLCVPKDAFASAEDVAQLWSVVEDIRSSTFKQLGLVLPFFDFERKETEKIEVLLRGIPVISCSVDEENVLEKLKGLFASMVEDHQQMLMDDVMTRRLLDLYSRERGEMVDTLVPGLVTLTQLTGILKRLLKEGISIRYFDIILQTIAEQAPIVGVDRLLHEEVRIALSPIIRQQLTSSFGAPLNAWILDEAIIANFTTVETEGGQIHESVSAALNSMKELLHGSLIVTFKGCRARIQEYLKYRGCNVTVVGYEEVDGLKLEIAGMVRCENPGEILEDLAA